MRSPKIIVAVSVVALLGLSVVTVAMPGWDDAVAWGIAQQRLFHRDLATQLRELGAGNPAAGWGLVMVSFLYGILHAAGPGHGKVVIATYLVTHESRVSRGIGLAAASSLCQGLVAIILVYGLIFIAGWLPRETQMAVVWTERLSFGLLAAMGAVFAVRAIAGMIAVRRHEHHEHGHGCGCRHGPLPHRVAQAHGFRAAVGVILSVGLRPCSGAVLVLVFAHVLGLPWAGIGSVIAMSAGTAITVAALALLMVKARRWATVLIGGEAKGYRWLGRVMALLGGVTIFLLGASLLIASLGPAHPLKV